MIKSVDIKRRIPLNKGKNLIARYPSNGSLSSFEFKIFLENSVSGVFVIYISHTQEQGEINWFKKSILKSDAGLSNIFEIYLRDNYIEIEVTVNDSGIVSYECEHMFNYKSKENKD